MPIKCYYLPLKPRKLTVYIYLLRGALIWIALLWGSNDMYSMVSLKHQLWTLPATDTMQKGIHKFFSWDSPVLQFAMACCSSRDSLKTSKNYSGEMMSYIYIYSIYSIDIWCANSYHTLKHHAGRFPEFLGNKSCAMSGPPCQIQAQLQSVTNHIS